MGTVVKQNDTRDMIDLKGIGKKVASSSFLRSSVLVPCGTVLSFLMTISIAGVMIPSEFGYYSSILYLANFLTIALSFGIPISAQMRIPAFLENQKYQEARDFIYMCRLLVITILTAALVVTALCVISGNVYGVLLTLCASSGIVWVFQRYLALGFDLIGLAIIPRDILFPAIIIVMCWLGFISDGFKALFFHAALLIIITLPVLYIVLKRGDSFSQSGVEFPSVIKVKNLIVDSAPFAIVRLGELGTAGAEIIVLGYFLPLELVGIYAFVFRFTLVGSLINRIINVANGQKFSRFFAAKQYGRFRTLYLKCIVVSSIVSVLLLIVVLFFGETILQTINKNYVEGYSVLAILMVGQAVGAALGPTTIALNMMAKQKQVAIITTVMAVVSVLLCIIFVKKYELIGVALIVSCSLVASRILQLIFLYRLIGRE